jgi:hypothetical protein
MMARLIFRNVVLDENIGSWLAYGTIIHSSAHREGVSWVVSFRASVQAK